MPDFIDVAPSDNAYTPAMAKLKKLLEKILTSANNDNLADINFRDEVISSTLEIKGLMATILMQDILYKAGVEYNRRDFPDLTGYPR